MERYLHKHEGEDKTMKSPFSKEVYIRLTDDESALICTSKYGCFFSKVITFPLRKEPAQDLEAEIAVRRLTRWPRSVLGLTDSF